ncbi:hypothetical protein B0H14DRAFT_2590769 [Mycena olivaceomarginata]|nr:hypothetical protein B0H14DRAFT_2590769 [Mycena olivaceomarginata]
MAILAIYGINWEGPYLPFMVANGKDHTCMVVHITHVGSPKVKWDIPRATPFFRNKTEQMDGATEVGLAWERYDTCTLRLYMASAASASIYEQGWAFDEASINVDIIGHSTYHRLRHHCDLFGPCDVTPWEFPHQKWENQIGNMGKPTHFLQLLWSFPFQPTVLCGDRSRAFPIPVEFSDGREGSECLISIQAVFIWSALWSQSHGPVYRLKPVETLTRIRGIRVNTILPNNQGGPGWPKELVLFTVTLTARNRCQRRGKQDYFGLYSFRVLVDHVYSVQRIKDIEERPSRRPMICVGNAHCKHPFTEHQGNILGASYLRPGCFHDIMGAPGTPTKYCWVLPVYLIGMLGAPSQKLLGDPRFGSWEHPASSTGSIQGITERLLGASSYITWVVPSLLENMVGGSQDYYKEAPTTVRRFHENPECRIVVNLAEEGNAFYATAEAGMGVRGGQMKGAVSQAGGNTFYATAGGTGVGVE